MKKKRMWKSLGKKYDYARVYVFSSIIGATKCVLGSLVDHTYSIVQAATHTVALFCMAYSKLYRNVISFSSDEKLKGCKRIEPGYVWCKVQLGLFSQCSRITNYIYAHSPSSMSLMKERGRKLKLLFKITN